METIYLDYNATTPMDREVIEAMQPVLTGIFGNPSSTHSYGYDARKVVENARDRVAGLIQCRPEEIVFTSGGTESNNYAIKGIALQNRNRGKHLITSAIEHPATLEACRYLEKEGFEVSYIPVDSSGRIDPGEMEKAVRKDTILITVMHANNEIGTIQPIGEISRLARKYGIPFHTDAAQSAGKIPVLVGELGVDMLSLAGHKLYGPKGIGALYIREGMKLEKLIHGAQHEMNRRAGTENVLLIAGFGKACEIAGRDLGKNSRTMQQTRDALYKDIRDALPSVVRNGDPGHCLPNTLNLSFPGVDSNLLLSGMPGIAASAGAACHAEETDISHVLLAIGLAPDLALCTVRLSTGKMTSMKEAREAAVQIVQTASTLMDQGKTESLSEEVPGDIRLTRFTHGLGCACKLRPQDLEKVLSRMPVPAYDSILVDARDSDDATVWKLDEKTAWVQSVDFFTPVVDDPSTFGRIAAANALSDLYAMGARPLFALNIVAFPVRRLPLEVLHRILEGAEEIAAEAGIYILGGHSIEDNELKYGMVVNGVVHPEKILRNSGSRPGDRLILTKPLGTGILSTALKRNRIRPEWMDPLVKSMTGLNRIPAGKFPDYSVHAVTDVTGFGLLGHLLEMSRAGKVSARIAADQIPVLPGVEESVRSGMVPGGSRQNLDFVEASVRWERELAGEMRIILADAQTSGGLLISLPAGEADDYLAEIRAEGCRDAAIIGEIVEKAGHAIIVS